MANRNVMQTSARAGVAPTPGRCFTHYTGFRWGSGSPIKWLYWLTRCGPQPLQRISASWYRPMACTTSGSTLIRCSTAGRSSHMHRSSPSCFFCCCTIHLELSTCWHSTLQKHSHFQTPLENPSVQSHLVLLCFHERLCIFGPMGTIEMHYYYYYNFSSVLSNICTHA